VKRALPTVNEQNEFKALKGETKNGTQTALVHKPTPNPSQEGNFDENENVSVLTLEP